MKKIMLTLILFTTITVSSNLSSYKENANTSYFSIGIRQSNDSLSKGADVVSPYKAITPAPNPTWPSTPDTSDKTTCFDDAIEISFDGSYGEYFQSTSDRDYYVYKAYCTDYIRFNVESLNSLYECNINVYRSSNLEKPIYSYTNDDTRTGSNLDLIEPIYAYQGDVYYFEVYMKTYEVGGVIGLATGVADIGYTAKIISANEADCDSSDFKSKGYLFQDEIIYKDMSDIKVYFDVSLNKVVAGPNSYLDASIEAIERWNTVGCLNINILPVSNISDADIIFNADDLGGDSQNIAGQTKVDDSTGNYPYNKSHITFNTYVFEKWADYLNANEYSQELFILNVALHEIGHALNLGHLDYNKSNIMYSSVINLIQFGAGDIAVYRYLWG